MICAWIVTSRAVVGSSQMRIFGWQESAIAMTIRWRMPPEYWNGYSSKRSAAFWMPTRSISSMACFFASPREMPWCFSMTSVICEPIVRIGFSDVIGVLEDRGDLRAADAFPVLIGLELGEILALEHDRAVGDGAVGLEHAGERLGENALAGAGLADDGERFALVKVEGHAADGREVIVTDAEFYFNVLCGQNDVSVICHYSAPPHICVRGSAASASFCPTM